MDFTFRQYKKLLQTLQTQGFFFYTVSDFYNNKNPESPFILLRHDVEARYKNALRFAEIQQQMGIKGTYYFRLSNHKGNEEVIRKIAALGHETGYHYDDLSACRGDKERAINRFRKNLEYLRSIAPVTSVTMEGAPRSRFDNRGLWGEESSMKYAVSGMKYEAGSRKVSDETKIADKGLPASYNLLATHSKKEVHQSYHYNDFGIMCEPYFDIDFSEIAYYTDTGRRWDGKYAVRDRVSSRKYAVSSGEAKMQNDEVLHSDSSVVYKFPTFKTTNDMIKAIQSGTFPKKAMLTFHPQRWNDKPLPWLKELVWQNAKNQVKRILIKRTKS